MLFLVLLFWRCFNAVVIKTFFQADEYWQALEPAYEWVFGGAGLTWEWEMGLRSALHPLIYYLPYTIVKKFDLSFNWFIILPKVVNGLIAAIGEYFLYHYTLRKSNNPQLARTTLILSVISLWNFYCWPRSFANSLELTLTLVALYNYECSNITITLLVAAITCIIRPTNVIFWIYYIPKYIYLNFGNKRLILNLILKSILVTLSVVTIDAFVNYSFYHGLKFPLWQFYKFNVQSNLSAFYGVSRFDFYFFQAIPILLTTQLPFFIWGVWTTPLYSDLKLTLVLNLLVFTLLQHKEFRFIYPNMPALLIYSAQGVLQLENRISPFTRKIIAFSMVTLFVPAAWYLTQIHEAGEYALPLVLHERLINEPQASVGWLTPCHSTPWKSHLGHLKNELWYLTCEPPKNQFELLNGYMDESDWFYQDPISFLKLHFPVEDSIEKVDNFSFQKINKLWDHHCWPHYLVMFETLWIDGDGLNPIGLEHILNYDVVERLSNSAVHWDSRREGDLLVLRRR
ncbi:putative glycosylphosphatidylinositol-alpha 1,2 mannosyltransferase [Martiniozyma asiatica (nom. inval.)]|nr:putative glycosylphosphatidylinositol-alpha 1,2 mannosyltransferase [Martiniozyma asiatica]